MTAGLLNSQFHSEVFVIVWDNPLPSSGLRFSLIPYASAQTTQNKEAGEGFRSKVNAGLMLKLFYLLR
jgi:hypothetical protein